MNKFHSRASEERLQPKKTEIKNHQNVKRDKPKGQNPNLERYIEHVKLIYKFFSPAAMVNWKLLKKALTATLKGG